MGYTNALRVSMLCLFVAGCGQEQERVFTGLDCTADDTSELVAVIDTSTAFRSFVRPTAEIELKTPDDSVIGAVNLVREHPQGYVVLDSRVSHQAYLFGHDGAHIALLGSRGDGPNEYQELMDAQVDEDGRIYLLSRARRKILVYDKEGTFLEEMSFADMGMAPDRFHIMDVGSGTFLFFVLHPDFPGYDNNRIVLATFRNGQFEHDLSYQKTERTSERMFFSGGTFLLYDSTRLWVHPIFDHGTTIYDPSTGTRLGDAEDVTDRLPKPLISQALFDEFNRISDALDTFGSVTRLISQTRVGPSVMSFYTSGKDRPKHLVFHDACGKQIGSIVAADSFPLLYQVVGSSTDGKRFFIVDNNPGFNTNPSIQVFESVM
jgi:hypothetical protein